MARLKKNRKKMTKTSKLRRENERLREKIKGITLDLMSAERCLDFQCMKCNNKRCMNYICPLNDNT